MNFDSGKHDNNLGESGDQVPKDTYCKNVVPILIQNASDHFLVRTIQQELEMERVTREYEEIDKKIAVKLKEEMRKTQKVGSELDQQLYNATQIKNQLETAFETTGGMLNILKDETEKRQNDVKKLNSRRLETTKKVQEFAEQQTRNKKLKEKVEDLDKQVKELLDAPEVTLDQNFPKRKEDIRKRLQEKKEEFEMRRMKKNQIAEMKEQKVDFLMKINKRQDENKIKREKVEKKQNNIDKVRKETKQIWQEKQEKINSLEAKLDELTQELIETKERCEQRRVKLNEHKVRISQKEVELENLKKTCAMKQDLFQKQNEEKQQECEIEKGKLQEVEKKLDAQLAKSAQNLNLLNAKTEELANLKEEKENLTVRFYETKMKVVTRQFENRASEEQNNVLAEKLRFEKDEVEKLKTRIEGQEEELKEAEKKLEEYPKELDEKRRKIEHKHKAQVEDFLKQQNFHAAGTEFAQHRLDTALKEVESLNNEIKESKEKNDWDEMVLKRRRVMIKGLQEKVKRDRQTYLTMLEQTKQTQNQSGETIEAEQPGPVKASQELVAMEVMKTNDDEEDSSGRKSPGILKKFLKKPARLQISPKRVTFEGLSSESSSQSVEANKTEEASLDTQLDEWKNIVLKKKAKKAPMDFV